MHFGHPAALAAGAMSQSSDDGDHESLAELSDQSRPESRATAHTKDDHKFRSRTGLFMAVHLMHRKRSCKMCKSVSTAESPLASATISDRYGRLNPWAKYMKQTVTAEDGSKRQMRVPSSKLCLICYNVWRALGGDLSSLVCILLLERLVSYLLIAC